jgi:HAD superfamily hydrolase (TIGR01509 family)
MKQRKPRAVLFDLGNTLVSYYKPAEFGPILKNIVDDLLRYMAQHGRTYDSAAVLAEAHALNAERADLSVYPLPLRLQKLLNLDDFATHERELVKRFLAPVFATARLDAAALPLLADLRTRGFLTGIVSNTPWGSSGDDWRAELARHGLTADAVVFCEDCGKRKPDPHIFRIALDKLGVGPNEAMFVGDDARWDVFGARQAGMRAVLLDPSGDVEVESGVDRIRSLDEFISLIERGA